MFTRLVNLALSLLGIGIFSLLVSHKTQNTQEMRKVDIKPVNWNILMLVIGLVTPKVAMMMDYPLVILKQSRSSMDVTDPLVSTPEVLSLSGASTEDLIKSLEKRPEKVDYESVLEPGKREEIMSLRL